MSSLSEPATREVRVTHTARWMRRFLIALTILAWIAIAGVILWGLNKITNALILLGISILLAYLVYPIVKLLSRYMPKPLAILLVYLVVLSLIVVTIYFVVFTAVAQLVALITSIRDNIPIWLKAAGPIIQRLRNFGISTSAFSISSQQIVDQLLNLVNNLLPLANNIFIAFIDTIIVTSLSVYFLLVGPRTLNWVRTKTPLRWHTRINFFLDTLHRTMGGFIRGQITLATMTSIIMGIGYATIGVPYVTLLAVIIFIFEFIPQIGSYISISVALILTLATKGWQIALIAAVFSSLIQAGLNGQVLAPRILGHSVGIHPIISIGALLIGADLFGLMGAFLAAPIAGIVQIIVVTYWNTWKANHPEQFPEESKKELQAIDGPE